MKYKCKICKKEVEEVFRGMCDECLIIEVDKTDLIKLGRILVTDYMEKKSSN